jgi:hypothetical protein
MSSRHAPQETTDGGFLFICENILPLWLWVQSIQLIDDEAQLTALVFIFLAKISEGFDMLAFPDVFAIFGGLWIYEGE